ncbi:DNA repair protein RecN [Corynebacterium hindlerae]|uniref:DNA repair protein RecN n=1 Tax=Corynebacterium hindlerae TaxID=699041 RepID=UPI003AAA7D3A
MLGDIAIENLGVITSSALEFSPGLTVLTGETGAGKTMVVTGLRLLSGGRADASRVRTGADQAVVEGRFYVDEVDRTTREQVAAVLDDAGARADESGEIIATRVVNSTGRSKAHLGGRAVPAATLQDFASGVLTIHGQNDQLRLLSPAAQLEALDRSAEGLITLRDTYTAAYRTWKKLARDLKERTEKRRELAQEIDRLRFALDEIASVGPEPGEDADLVQLIRRLQDVDTLREAAAIALTSIDGADEGETPGAADLLGAAHAALGGCDDPDLTEMGERLGAITSELSDLSRELGSYLEGLPADPAALEESLQRQQELKTLTRKYAPDIDGVLTWRDKAEVKLRSIDVSSEALDALKAEVATAQRAMLAAGSELSAARRNAAEELGAKVTEEVHGLAMPKARFEVALTEVKPSSTGLDEVEFRLAGAPELDARPLATSASGGELSRVMLALEVILSAGVSGVTLVFDEVDAGVGGRAAVEIGRRLARLATQCQVIVVTHLPQVAAYADTHLHVSKEVSDAAQKSGVERLSEERRVVELSRMLAGLEDTETGRAHAQELLERARKDREALRQK